MRASARKAARGGLGNALFVQAAVESLPEELSGLADAITINFPWGSLLRAVALPQLDLLSAIARLRRPDGSLTLLVNASVFDDPAYCSRLGQPCPPVFDRIEPARASFGQAGLTVTDLVRDVEALPYRTTWSRKLTRGTRRRVLRLDAVMDRAGAA